MATLSATVAAVLKKTKSSAVGVSAQLSPATYTRSTSVAVAGSLGKLGILKTFTFDAVKVWTTTTTAYSMAFSAHLTKAGAQGNVAISAVLVSTPGATTEAFSLFRARNSRR